MIRRSSLLVLFVWALTVDPVSAQNWSFDARKVGLGSPSGGEDLASRMIDDERAYRSIVLPFGLIQVVRDFKKLNPSNDEFDLLRTIEYAAAPIHYTLGRDRSDSKADDFIVDIGNGELSRDLNDYKGFIPVNQPAAAGLAAPNWGKTFRVREGAAGSFQGLYVGVGPFISLRTAPTIDEQLISVLRAGDGYTCPIRSWRRATPRRARPPWPSRVATAVDLRGPQGLASEPTARACILPPTTTIFAGSGMKISISA